MPLLLHGVERSESQPDDTSLFVNRFVDPPDDDGVGLRCLKKGIASGCVLSRRFGQLVLFALTEEVDLGVDVLLPYCDLGLGYHGIVELLIMGGDFSLFSLTGIEHDYE